MERDRKFESIPEGSSAFLVEFTNVISRESYSTAEAEIIYSVSSVDFSGEQVLLRISHKNILSELKKGGIYWLESSAKRITKGKISGSFDRQSYYARKDIHFEFYVDESELIEAGIKAGNSVFTDLFQTRDDWNKVFNENLSPENAGIMTAMLLGDRSNLSSDIKSLFRSTGVTHILAVSGLHVGIVYLLVSSMLSFLRRLNLKMLYTILCILLIWLYAYLTGFTSSVIRASLMFSILAFGRLRSRSTNSYNIVAASAFFILIFSPQSLFNTGFLLSYSAVFGIISIYPILKSIYYSEHWFFKRVFDSLYISLSAQLGVLPIVLHQFGEFPVYFLLANLLAIPIAFLLVSGGFFILIISLLTGEGLILEILSTPLEYLFIFLTQYLSIIMNLPNPILNLSLSLEQSILIAVVIICSVVGIHLGSKKVILLSILFALLFTFSLNKKESKNMVYFTVIRNVPYLCFAEKDRYTIYFTGDSIRSNIRQKLDRMSNELDLGEATYRNLKREANNDYAFTFSVDAYDILWLSHSDELCLIEVEKQFDFIFYRGNVDLEFAKKRLKEKGILYLYNTQKIDQQKIQSICKENELDIRVLSYYDFVELKPTSPL